MKNINTYFLTNDSKKKILEMTRFYPQTLISKYAHSILNKMILSGSQYFTVENISNYSLFDIKKTFNTFCSKINIPNNSKLMSDISNMDLAIASKLIINDYKINIYFIYSSSLAKSEKIMGVIIHAISTFCNMFPYDYNNLDIFVALDENTRILNHNPMLNIPQRFEHYKQQSSAFNPSGMTNRGQNIIILTKIEEIIKLLFHELIHYIGIDASLYDVYLDVEWDLADTKINLNEAYTEYISVLLSTMYQSIHYANLNNLDIYKTFDFIIDIEINYSIQLLANILFFYGYDENNYLLFFNNGNKKLSCPIYIFSYIFVRTFLLLNYVKLLDLTHGELRLSPENITLIKRYGSSTHSNLKMFYSAIKNSHLYNNISYLSINLDWQKF